MIALHIYLQHWLDAPLATTSWREFLSHVLCSCTLPPEYKCPRLSDDGSMDWMLRLLPLPGREFHRPMQHLAVGTPEIHLSQEHWPWLDMPDSLLLGVACVLCHVQCSCTLPPEYKRPQLSDDGLDALLSTSSWAGVPPSHAASCSRDTVLSWDPLVSGTSTMTRHAWLSTPGSCLCPASCVVLTQCSSRK